MRGTNRRFTVVFAAFLATAAARANTYTVTSAGDSGAGTLRQAILDANANGGADTIGFNIAGSGVHTITPATPLPPITDAVTIDGYTQAGAAANTQPTGALNTVLRIEISGAGTTGSGLDVRAQNVTIRGLVINRFSLGQVDGNSSFNHANMVVHGCFLGSSPGGLVGYSGGSGATVTSPNFLIGGDTPSQRNLISLPSIGTTLSISGAASGFVRGNLIGTDITGSRRIAGLEGDEIGLFLGSTGFTVVGGTLPGDGNVIAGFEIAINLNASMTGVQGNSIGVDAAHTTVIPGGTVGIIVNAADGVIGGDGNGEGNVIGGFDYGVVFDNHVISFQGNGVGTDKTGTKNLGNRILGLLVSTDDQVVGGVLPGEANVIAFNGWAGVVVEGAAQQNPLRGNRIFGNGIGGVGASGGPAMGIDLTFGPTPGGLTPNDDGDADEGNGNDYQNFPILASAAPEGGGTRVIGTLNSLASTVFDLDFYANPICRPRPRDLPQAETFLGSLQVTTDGSGNASFNALLPTPIQAGQPVRVTATDPIGNTSELWQEIALRMNKGVGGPGDASQQSILGHRLDPAATLTIGGNPVPLTFISPTEVRFVGPALSPGGVYDVVVTNPGGESGTIRNGYVSRFSDVAEGSLFDILISRLVAGGITAGIGGGNYGPSNDVTRQQMAVFVLKAKHGICYTPPPCQGVFPDVPCTSPFAPWIEQFAAEGITGGCGGGNYCPTNPARRDQMAVFLLKARFGSTFVPPACGGLFDDVACPSPFADWIELLAAEQITGGCGGNNYCPLNNNTRGQMAAFIARTFTLP